MRTFSLWICLLTSACAAPNAVTSKGIHLYYDEVAYPEGLEPEAIDAVAQEWEDTLELAPGLWQGLDLIILPDAIHCGKAVAPKTGLCAGLYLAPQERMFVEIKFPECPSHSALSHEMLHHILRGKENDAGSYHTHPYWELPQANPKVCE